MDDAYKFAGQMGIQLFETSAKENINVEEVTCWERGESGPLIPHRCGSPRLTFAEPPPLAPLPLQMFNCITELVLRAKKDNLAKQQQQQQNDVVKLTKNSKRKKRCC